MERARDGERERWSGGGMDKGKDRAATIMPKSLMIMLDCMHCSRNGPIMLKLCQLCSKSANYAQG